ncbi:MAG: helix-turn-helix transcriptional regulator [Oligoflexia bacterium]|nr:helix-turn-helix transcriptional regulator [Oligoflexia bacterium]
MGRPKNFEREDVIQQAMELFWLKGYAATSLSDLTEATGLNKKSLYNEFGSKEELFNIALNAYNQSKLRQIELLTEEPFGKQNVINYLEDVAQTSSKKGCLMTLSIHESELLEKEAKLDVQKSFKGLQGLIFKNLSVDYDKKKAKSLALLMSSMIFSIASLGKLKVDKKEIKSMIKELIILL